MQKIKLKSGILYFLNFFVIYFISDEKLQLFAYCLPFLFFFFKQVAIKNSGRKQQILKLKILDPCGIFLFIIFFYSLFSGYNLIGSEFDQYGNKISPESKNKFFRVCSLACAAFCFGSSIKKLKYECHK